MNELLKSLLDDLYRRIFAKDPTALESAAQLTEQYPKDKDVWYLLAMAHGMKGDMDSAVLAINRLADFAPPEPAIFLVRGEYEEGRGNLQAALADYTAGIELSKQLQKNDDLESLYFWRAHVLVALGRNAEALADLEHVPDGFVQWTPEKRTKLDLLAKIEGGPIPWKAMSEPLDSLLDEIEYRVHDERRAALGRAKQLAEQYPDEPGVWYTLTHVHAANSDLDSAISAITRMMAVTPPLPASICLRGHFIRAHYEHKRGNLQAALADFDKAIALAEQLQDESRLEELYFRRADVLVALGRKAEARADLEHVPDGFVKLTTKIRTKADILDDCAE